MVRSDPYGMVWQGMAWRDTTALPSGTRGEELGSWMGRTLIWIIDVDTTSYIPYINTYRWIFKKIRPEIKPT